MHRSLFLALLVAGGCSSSSLSDSPDLAAPAHSSQLLAGDWQLRGILKDQSLLLYQQEQAYVLAPTAQSPTVIGPAEDAWVIDGDLVLLFTNVDATTNRAALAVWSADGGLQPLSEATYEFGPITREGDYLLYLDHVTSDAASGDLVTSRLDGSERRVIATGIPTGTAANSSTCSVFADALGSAFLASFCPGSSDGGVASPALVRFDPASGTSKAVAYGDQFPPIATVDAAHDSAFTSDDTSAGIFIDKDGNATTIDQNVLGGMFTSDGTLLYTTFTPELKRWDPKTKASASLQSLTSGTFPFLQDLSPDDKTALFSINAASSAPFGFDLWTASTTQPKAPLGMILSTTTGEPATFAGASSNFTRDSAYVLYAGPIDASFTGPLQAAPAAGGAGTMITKNVAELIPTHGSRVVYCAFETTTATTCSLFDIDVAQPGTPAAVDTSVLGAMYLSGDRLYYAVKDSADRSGIYARTVY